MKSQDEPKEYDQINIKLNEMSDLIKLLHEENKALKRDLIQISNQQSSHIDYLKEQFNQLNSTVDKIHSMSQAQQYMEEKKSEVKEPNKIIDSFDKNNQHSNKKEYRYEEVIYGKDQVLQLLDHMQQFEDNQNKKSIISDNCDLRELIIEYVPKRYQNDSELQKQLEELLMGYQNVRGDGNCFYTAFMFSFLQLLKRDQQLKNKLLNKISEVKPIQLCVNNQQVPLSMTQFLLKEFVQYVSIINCRDIKNDFLQKYVQIQSVVFLRCLLLNQWENYKDLSSEYDQSINQLVDWGVECNENELAIKILNEHFEIQILLFYFQPDRIRTNLYGIENKSCISLIFRQGHYCIAIPKKGVELDKFDQFQLVYEDLGLIKSINLSKQSSQDSQSDILSSKQIINQNLFIQPKEELDNQVWQNGTCYYHFQVRKGSYNFIIAFCFSYLLVNFKKIIHQKEINQFDKSKEFNKVYQDIIKKAWHSLVTYQQFENYLIDQFNAQQNNFRDYIRKSYLKKQGFGFRLAGKLNFEQPTTKQEFENIAESMGIKLIIYESENSKLLKRDYGSNKDFEIKLLWNNKQQFHSLL
ncbi:OTU domain [Paramecium bursaria]